MTTTRATRAVTPGAADTAGGHIAVEDPVTGGELARIPAGGPDEAARLVAAAAAIDQFAELGALHRGRSLAGSWDAVDLTVHEPFGVAVALTPWNDPAAVAGQAAATLLLAAGNGDVDPRWAAAQAATGAFANCGHVCTSVERIYVHRAIAEPFLDALVREAEAVVVGDPLRHGVAMGPMVDTAQRGHVLAQLADATGRGARILTGGGPPGGPGAFMPRTVVIVPDDSSRLMREETFDPVAAVRVAEDFAAGLRAACDTDYGLAATVPTASQEHARSAWRTLPAGTVKVNAVWGGAPGGAAQPRRSSGRGFGYGPELLDEVTRVKVVHMRPAVTP